MATRDLTRQFLQLRADAKAKVLRRKNIVSHREKDDVLVKSTKQDSTSVAIAPGWVSIVNGTNQHVARIKGMMEKLNKLHTSRLMVRFDGSESKYEQEIDHVTLEITGEFRSAEKSLRRMAHSDRNEEFSAADAKTRQNVQRALATQLQTLSSDFRKSQKMYLARIKNQKEGPVEFDFLTKSDAKSKRHGRADTGFTQAQVTEVEIAEDVINERDQEIQRIATSITELATIFKELAVLVIDQGTILDRIDYNMEQVVEQTEKGIEELEKAEATQKNSRPMKCISLLLVMIFIMTVLLVLKHSIVFVIFGLSNMEVELKQQQTLMCSLRVFVDTLRDIKDTWNANVINHNVVAAVRVLCAASETQNNVQWHVIAWRRGLVPIFQRLCLCKTRLDELEAQERKKMRSQTLEQVQEPKAPAGLLSLRDYSVLQAAVEVLFCWGAYPRVAAGVLVPIEKRRPTRTLAISTDVLMWGHRQYVRDVGNAEVQREDATSELLEITQALLQLLSLPQFQPILLPKYVVELLALLVFGEVAVNTKTAKPVQTEFIRLREMMLRVLPLRMSMSSLRAALGQATPAASEEAVGQRFKARCGNLLSRLLMKNGGIVATIEILLGAVEEGNTQARMQVATLICQCPSDEDAEKYATALCTQVCELLLAAVTPEMGNTTSKLLGEMAALLADQVAIRHPGLFDTQILSVLFHPLLIYEDSRYDVSVSDRGTNEEALTCCVGIARLLICGPPPSQQFLQALAPIVRPLLHMYAFAASSKSYLATPLRATLTTWIRSCSSAAILLQAAVLPVTLPLQPTLAACGYERNHAEDAWIPLRQFVAGGGGGISLRLIPFSTSSIGETKAAPESLKALIMPLVELLGDKELQDSKVVGDLFSSLLLTYMHVRKGRKIDSIDFDDKNGSAPSALALYELKIESTSAESVEIVLMLLLALIECLGPSVLRSAATVLQCIATILEAYNTPVLHIADKKQQSESIIQTESTEGEEEGDEILTICLGVVMTILEVGSSLRSDSEEQQLCAMLPVLEKLSRHPRPEAAELASNARAQILSRRAAKSNDTNTTEAGKQSFEAVLQKVEQDLSSELVPLRARGVVTLTRLVRQSHSHACDAEWVPRVHTLARVFLLHVQDSESYVFLAAVQGLAALADTHPNVAIPALVKALGDLSNSLESRIKLSEALLFSAKRCGETLPKYGKLFVYAYLDCIRPSASMKKRVKRIQKEVSKRVQLVQEVDIAERTVAATEEANYLDNESQSEQELLATATLRASCLSNLAEVCVLLQWGLQPYLMDVLTCVFGVIQLELAKCRPMSPGGDIMEDDDQKKLRRHQEKEQQQCVVTVRRGAVFVLRYLVELLGWKMLEIMPDQLSPLYHTLKHVARVDWDEVVVFHAKRALSALDNVMRAELFPPVKQQDTDFGISSLRIL